MTEYDRKRRWLDAAPAFTTIGGTTPGGQRVVGIKIGTTQSHGQSVWYFSNGQTAPGSSAPANFVDLVPLVPAEDATPWEVPPPPTVYISVGELIDGLSQFDRGQEVWLAKGDGDILDRPGAVGVDEDGDVVIRPRSV